MNGDEIGLPKKLILLRILDADCLALLRGEILAPCHHLHPECLRDAGRAGAELAKPNDAEREAFEVEPYGALPGSPGLQAGILIADAPGELEHEADGNARGGISRGRGAAHDDAMLPGRGDVDRGIAHAGGDQELEIGQLLDHSAGESGALAHGTDDLEALQRLDDVLLAAEVLVEDLAVELGSDFRPVGRFEGDVLIIVENRAATARHCRFPFSVGTGGSSEAPSYSMAQAPCPRGFAPRARISSAPVRTVCGQRFTRTRTSAGIIRSSCEPACLACQRGP